MPKPEISYFNLSSQYDDIIPKSDTELIEKFSGRTTTEVQDGDKPKTTQGVPKETPIAVPPQATFPSMYVETPKETQKLPTVLSDEEIMRQRVEERYKRAKNPNINKESLNTQQTQQSTYVPQWQSIYQYDENKPTTSQKPQEQPIDFSKTQEERRWEEFQKTGDFKVFHPISKSFTLENIEPIRKELNPVLDKKIEEYDKLQPSFLDQLKNIHPIAKNLEEKIGYDVKSGLYDENRLNYRIAKNLLIDAKNTLNAPTKEEGGGYMSGLGQELKQLDTWVTIVGLADNLQKSRVVKLGQSGKPLLKSEEALLDAIFYYYYISNARAGNISKAYSGGKMAGQSIPFMLDFVMTGGFAAGTSTGLTKAMVRHIERKLITKLGKEGYETLTKIGVDRLITAPIKLAGELTTGAKQAVISPTFYTGVLEETMAKPVEKKLGGGYVYVQGAPVKDAIIRGMTEFMFERSGEFIGDVLTPVGKLLKNTNYLYKISSTPIGRFNKLFYDGSGKFAKAIKLTGFDGLPTELGEEVLGQIANYLMGVSTKEEMNEFFSKDNLQTMILGFLPMTVISGAGNVMSKVKVNYDHKQAIKNINTIFGENAPQIIMSIDNATPTQLSSLIDDVLLNNNGYVGNKITDKGKQMLDAIVGYAGSKVKVEAMNGIAQDEFKELASPREVLITEENGKHKVSLLDAEGEPYVEKSFDDLEAAEKYKGTLEQMYLTTNNEVDNKINEQLHEVSKKTLNGLTVLKANNKNTNGEDVIISATINGISDDVLGVSNGTTVYVKANNGQQSIVNYVENNELKRAVIPNEFLIEQEETTLADAFTQQMKVAAETIHKTVAQGNQIIMEQLASEENETVNDYSTKKAGHKIKYNGKEATIIQTTMDNDKNKYADIETEDGEVIKEVPLRSVKNPKTATFTVGKKKVEFTKSVETGHLQSELYSQSEAETIKNSISVTPENTVEIKKQKNPTNPSEVGYRVVVRKKTDAELQNEKEKLSILDNLKEEVKNYGLYLRSGKKILRVDAEILSMNDDGTFNIIIKDANTQWRMENITIENQSKLRAEYENETTDNQKQKVESIEENKENTELPEDLNNLTPEQELVYAERELGVEQTMQEASATIKAISKQIEAAEKKKDKKTTIKDRVAVQKEINELKAKSKIYSSYILKNTKAPEVKSKEVKKEAPKVNILDKWKKAKKYIGNKAAITLPNGQIIKGHYYLVEAEAPTASHNPNKNFQKSEDFPVDENGKTINDRDYENDKAAQYQVIDKGGRYDSRAIENPVIVSPEGIVLSGNDRTMSGQLAAVQGTDNAYIDYLNEYSENYGFTQEQISEYKHPRIVFVASESIPLTTETFAMFNTDDRKSQNKTEKAVKVGKTISEETVLRIARIFNRYDKLTEVYNSPAATSDILDVLLNDKIIQPNEVSALLSPNGTLFSGQGRDMVESLIIGSVLTEDAVRIVNSKNSLKQAILTAIVPLLQNAKMGEMCSLKEEIDLAIKLSYESSKVGMTIQQYMSQTVIEGFMEDPKDIYAITVVRVAEQLSSEKYADFRKFILSYNEIADAYSQGQVDMFTNRVLTKEEIIEQLLNINSHEQKQNSTEQVRPDDTSKGKSKNRRGEKQEASVDRSTQERGDDRGTDTESSKQPVEKVKEGKILPPSRNDKLIESANSNPDLESTQAVSDLMFNAVPIQTNRTEIERIISEAKESNTYLKAPNGNPTKLNENQWVQVRTKAFKDWFGDWENDPENASKVVDENGEPLVVYHGGGKNIIAFDYNRIGQQGRSEGAGFEFTENKSLAQGYAERHGGGLYNVFLNIRNNISDIEQKTLTKNKKIHILKLFNDKVNNNKQYIEDLGKDTIFSDYSDSENISTAIKETVEMLSDDTDLDFINEFINTTHMNKEILEAFKEVTGYDGVILEKTDEWSNNGLYVAFTNTQIKSATENIGTFDSENEDIRFATAPTSDIGFYSTVENALLNIKQEKGTKEQFKVMLLNNGAKQAELDWMGFDELPEKLTKTDIQNWIDENRIEVKEVEKGGFDDGDIASWWNDEGGANEEVDFYDLSESEKRDARERYSDEVGDWGGTETKFSSYVLPGGENYKELLLTMPSKRYGLSEEGIAKRESNTFRSSHFDEPNILAHIRFDERTVNGERVLFLEEIQSDWAQEGKKKGFKGDTNYDAVLERENVWDVGGVKVLYFERGVDGKNYRTINKNREQVWFKTLDDAVKQANDTVSNTSEKEIFKVPSMPFRKTDQWVKLAIRRMMRYAAENGFDRIAWTTGEQQAERYDLSKHINQIDYRHENENSVWIDVFDKDDRRIESVSQRYAPNELENTFGKDVANKIINRENLDEEGGNIGSLTGVDLKVGGEGMKAFYDAIVPSAMNKLGKPFGAKVENVSIKQKDNGFTLTLKDNNGNVTINQFDSKTKAYSWLTNAVNNGDKYEVISEEDGAILSLQQSIPVTESMKESVMEGMPLFKLQSQPDLQKQQAEVTNTQLSNLTSQERVARVQEAIEQINDGKVVEYVDDMNAYLLEAYANNQEVLDRLAELQQTGCITGGITQGDTIVINTNRATINDCLSTFEHERQHIEVRINPLWQQIKQDIIQNVNAKKLDDAVAILSGTDFYRGVSVDELADEYIAHIIQHVFENKIINTNLEYQKIIEDEYRRQNSNRFSGIDEWGTRTDNPTTESGGQFTIDYEAERDRFLGSTQIGAEEQKIRDRDTTTTPLFQAVGGESTSINTTVGELSTSTNIDNASQSSNVRASYIDKYLEIKKALSGKNPNLIEAYQDVLQFIEALANDKTWSKWDKTAIPQLKSIRDSVRELKKAGALFSIRKKLDMAMELVLQRQYTTAEHIINKFAKLKLEGTTAKGVKTQKKVDASTQIFFTTLNSALSKDQETSVIAERIADLNIKLSETTDQATKDNFEAQIRALTLLHQHKAEQNRLGLNVDTIASEIDDISKEFSLRDNRKEIMAAYNKISANKKKLDNATEREKVDIFEENIKLKDRITKLQSERKAIKGDIKHDKKSKAKLPILKEMLLNARLSQQNEMEWFIKELDGVLREGIRAKRAFVAKEKAHKEQIIEEALRAIDYTTDKSFMNPNKKENRKTLWSKFIHSIDSFASMLKMLDVNAPDGRGLLFTRFFTNGIMEASKTEQLGLKASTLKLDKKIQEIFGKGFHLTQLQKLCKQTNGAVITLKSPKEVKNIESGERDIIYNEEEMALDNGQALYIYAIAKMPDGLIKLNAMGIDQEQIDAVADTLSDELKQYQDWIQEEFLPELRVKYNATHVQLFGTQLDQIENYFKLNISRGDLQQETQIEDSAGYYGLPKTDTGSILKRVYNKNAIDIENSNAIETLIEHLHKMEHWNAYAPVIKDLNTLNSNPAFKKHINRYIYNGAAEDFKTASQIAVGAYTPKGKGGIEDAIVAAAKLYAVGKISFRLNTALKQALALIQVLGYGDMALVKHSFRAAVNPLSIKWCMQSIPDFEKRWKDRAGGDSNLMIRGDMDGTAFEKLHTRISDLASKGMLPNAAVDLWSCAIIGKGMYDTKLSYYKNRGYSEEESIDLALKDAEIAYNETMQSAEAGYLAAVQRDKTWWSATFSLFNNASIAYQRLLIEGLKGIGKQLSPKQRADMIAFQKAKYLGLGRSVADADKFAKSDVNKALRKNIMQVAMNGYIVQLVWNLGSAVGLMKAVQYLIVFSGDDDDAKDRALEELKDDLNESALKSFTTPIRGLPGGKELESAVELYLNGWNIRQINIESNPLISDTKDFCINMSEGFKNNDWVRILNALVRYGVGFAGLDLNTFANISYGIFDVIENHENITTTDVIYDLSLLLNAPRSEQKFLGVSLRDGDTYQDIMQRYISLKRVHKYGVFSPLTNVEDKRATQDVSKIVNVQYYTLRDMLREYENVADKYNEKNKDNIISIYENQTFSDANSLMYSLEYDAKNSILSSDQLNEIKKAIKTLENDESLDKMYKDMNIFLWKSSTEEPNETEM